MRNSVARLKGIGFVLWHIRHYFYHILLGLVLSWFLRELWHTFSGRLLLFAITGSLIPDFDHFIYFFTYGKKDWYTKQVRKFLRNHEWRTLVRFVEVGHKSNTDLMTHNYYFMVFLFLVSIMSFFIDWKVGVILFGTMLLHYLFDVFDDIITLGYINSNWKRWGRSKNEEVISG